MEGDGAAGLQRGLLESSPERAGRAGAEGGRPPPAAPGPSTSHLPPSPNLHSCHSLRLSMPFQASWVSWIKPYDISRLNCHLCDMGSPPPPAASPPNRHISHYLASFCPGPGLTSSLSQFLCHPRHLRPVSSRSALRPTAGMQAVQVGFSQYYQGL